MVQPLEKQTKNLDIQVFLVFRCSIFRCSLFQLSHLWRPTLLFYLHVSCLCLISDINYSGNHLLSDLGFHLSSFVPLTWGSLSRRARTRGTRCARSQSSFETQSLPTTPKFLWKQATIFFSEIMEIMLTRFYQKQAPSILFLKQNYGKSNITTIKKVGYDQGGPILSNFWHLKTYVQMGPKVW
jgi:hypothetical protein